MKVFGVSFLTILIVVAAYILGAKFPGPVNAVAAKL